MKKENFRARGQAHGCAGACRSGRGKIKAKIQRK
jgi:hypothetical protein